MNYLQVKVVFSSAASATKMGLFAGISVIFSILGRVLRGVTNGGAIAGAIICFVLLLGGGFAAFVALFCVFVLTWLSTRIGYSRKQRLGAAESGRGRDALQVLANLGTSAGCALLYKQFPNPWILAAMAAALSEPAADTVSSEIGQAFGGTPRLITNWQKAGHGTNGAITAIGTIAGVLAAIAVALVFLGSGDLGRAATGGIVIAAIVGMIADSLLGATIEGHGPFGNNAVNFLSTLVAAICAFLIGR